MGKANGNNYRSLLRAAGVGKANGNNYRSLLRAAGVGKANGNYYRSLLRAAGVGKKSGLPGGRRGRSLGGYAAMPVPGSRGCPGRGAVGHHAGPGHIRMPDYAYHDPHNSIIDTQLEYVIPACPFGYRIRQFSHSMCPRMTASRFTTYHSYFPKCNCTHRPPTRYVITFSSAPLVNLPNLLYNND